MESKLRTLFEANSDLTKTLEFFQSKKNGIELDRVKLILARMKVNDVGYTLIETQDYEQEWYKDVQILNVQETPAWQNIKQVNYCTIFTQLKESEDQLTQTIQ